MDGGETNDAPRLLGNRVEPEATPLDLCRRRPAEDQLHLRLLRRLRRRVRVGQQRPAVARVLIGRVIRQRLRHRAGHVAGERRLIARDGATLLVLPEDTGVARLPRCRQPPPLTR